MLEPLAHAGIGRHGRGAIRPDRARLPTGDLALVGRRADMGAVLLRAHRSHQPAPRGWWRRRRGVSATGRPAAIALAGVTVQREGVPVLRGIDWLVEVGDRWVILGPNGSGKTTLLASGRRPAVADLRHRGRCWEPASGQSTSGRCVHAWPWSAARSRDSSEPTWWHDSGGQRALWGAGDVVEPVHGRGLGEGGRASGPRRRRRHRRPPVRGDFGRGAPAGAAGPGAHGRPRAASSRRAVRRARSRGPGAPAGPPRLSGSATPGTRRSSS